MSDWKDRAVKVDSSNDWKSRATPIVQDNPDTNLLNTIISQAGAGFTGGFDDELGGALNAVGKAAGIDNLNTWSPSISSDGPTLDMDKLKQAYIQNRDMIRAGKDAQQEAHPVISTAANIAGMVANPLASGEMGIAKLAGLGAVQGLGDSKADLTSGDIDQYLQAAKDTAIGGGIGAATGVAAPYIGKGLNAAANKMSPELVEYLTNKMSGATDTFNKGLSKVGEFTSGADSDALLRNIQRPVEMAAAKDDGFALNLGKQAVNETSVLGQNLGENVSKAKWEFLKQSGHQDYPEIGKQLAGEVDEFLANNAPSNKGFSALSDSQTKTLEEISESLKGNDMTGEDLVKVRDYLDNVEKLASQYEKESGPYTNFLKGLRGAADYTLDQAAPDVDKANKAFAQYKDDTGLLRSSQNEGQAESMINNLYGANKGAQQEAAGRLFSPDTLEQAKDIAANKAVSRANAPGGQNYFRHGSLPALTFGTSELVTRPELVAKSFRALGMTQQWIGETLQQAPEVLGPYVKILSDAASRGPEALTATHFLLQQNNPDYRQMIQKMDKDK